MILRQINFRNFRNFERRSFIISPFLTIIIGENARGKTNLLEGVYVIFEGEGFREDKEEELVLLGKNNGYVEGVFMEKDEKFIYRVLIDKRSQSVQKLFFINKVKKKQNQYLKEQIKTVLFSPEQIEIITGAPSIRRKYFDKLLGFYDYQYKKSLDNYENALKRRNKILEGYKNENQLIEEIKFWNDYLISQAEYLIKERERYVDYLNSQKKLDSKEFSIEYIKNEFNKLRIKEFFEKEKQLRKTLIGPQKDDFQIYLEGKNIHHFGSRSEQRMAIFWLKMNEIHYHEKIRKKKPIILLDDIFSELDTHHKKIILDLVKNYQTITTTTEPEIIQLAKISNIIIHL